MNQSMVKLNCKIAALPSRYRKITLPAPIMRVVGYRVLTPQMVQTIEAITAEFLISDPRYCEYFEIENELETDDTSGEKEAEKEEKTVSETDGEVEAPLPDAAPVESEESESAKVEAPLPDAAPKMEETKPDVKEKKAAKKRTTKKGQTRRRSTRKKTAAKDNGGDSESS